MCFCREWLLPVEELAHDITHHLEGLGFVNIENVGGGGCGYSSLAEALIKAEVKIPVEYRCPGQVDSKKWILWANHMAGIDPCPGRVGYTHTHTQHIHTHTHTLTCSLPLSLSLTHTHTHRFFPHKLASTRIAWTGKGADSTQFFVSVYDRRSRLHRYEGQIISNSRKKCSPLFSNLVCLDCVYISRYVKSAFLLSRCVSMCVVCAAAPDYRRVLTVYQTSAASQTVMVSRFAESLVFACLRV